MGFVHLHVHTEYSLLDGACRIKDLISKVKSCGQKAVAITDHGVMYGVIEFYKEAKKQGIKPIIGCEVYLAPRTIYDKVHGIDSELRHLILLCKNEIGYKNLIYMVSKSWSEGFYSKPRIDLDLLRKHSEGLIGLSACIMGEIPRLLRAGDYNAAKDKAIEFSKIFEEESFYLELQDQGIAAQKNINKGLIEISKETGIPLVITNDCHYINHEDSFVQDLLLCIQTNSTLEDPKRFRFSSDQFFLKTEEEIREIFPGLEEALENTLKIADMCNLEIEFGKTKLPRFDVPNNEDHFEYFKGLCYEGLKTRYGDNPGNNLKERLDYELSTIKKMGYVDYYLIVYDFVRYAKSKDIPVGPGRGSGAGSLAAYCIGITGVDPMKYDLLFERFLNPERVSMPDFDVDFCYARRHEVIDYVIKKYGSDHVAQIVTFGTMAAKAAVRDIGRAMGMTYQEVDNIARMIPFDIGVTIDKALSSGGNLKEAYDSDEKTRRLIDVSKKVEGMPRHASTHAAGVVITDKPVYEYVPLAKNEDAIVTQFSMTTLEELGLLKMDFLGLRNLTILKRAETMVKERFKDFSIEDINLEDKEVFDMISRGETEGVFQLESYGMTKIIKQLKPNKIEDLIAIISLYRPGPVASIPKYIENRHDKRKIKYRHPLLSKILDVTYGCIIYQEQVMQIFRSLAGYSLGRADIVRRAMAKKKADVMQREREVFINGLLSDDGSVLVEGCIRRGVDAKIASEIYDEMYSFASYAFNKSHAASYAIISYQTAYIKCKYPEEFMAATLTSVLDGGVAEKFGTYIYACSKMGIKILGPDIKKSHYNFDVVEKGKIRTGFLAIKGMSSTSSKVIELEREKKEFTSFYDFCSRMLDNKVNIRVINALIKSGALDSINSNRKKMLAACDDILRDIQNKKGKNIEGQLAFFDNLKVNSSEDFLLPEVSEFPWLEKLALEREVMGVYISGHPLDEYKKYLYSGKFDMISDALKIINESQETEVKVKTFKFLAVILSVKLKMTKANRQVANLLIEDLSGNIEVTLFSDTIRKYSEYLHEGNIVEVSVNIKTRGQDLVLVGNYVNPINKQEIQKSDKTLSRGLYLKIPHRDSVEYKKAKNLLEIFEGSTPVYIYFEEEKKLFKSPRSMWIYPDESLIRELRFQIGESSVVLKI